MARVARSQKEGAGTAAATENDYERRVTNPRIRLRDINPIAASASAPPITQVLGFENDWKPPLISRSSRNGGRGARPCFSSMAVADLPQIGKLFLAGHRFQLAVGGLA